jgi:hypothetical protein
VITAQQILLRNEVNDVGICWTLFIPESLNEESLEMSRRVADVSVAELPRDTGLISNRTRQ